MLKLTLILKANFRIWVNVLPRLISKHSSQLWEYPYIPLLFIIQSEKITSAFYIFQFTFYHATLIFPLSLLSNKRSYFLICIHNTKKSPQIKAMAPKFSSSSNPPLINTSLFSLSLKAYTKVQNKLITPLIGRIK